MMPTPLSRWLEALAKDPNDDDLRRVVADALSAEGDVRGEYMTLFLKQASSGLSSTHLKRLTKLFEQNHRAWLGPLEKVRFSRARELGCFEDLERWEHGVPVRLCAMLNGSTKGDAEWWTIRELWLVPSVSFPTELEHSVTKHLRAVFPLGWLEGGSERAWAALLEDYLRSIGRAQLFRAPSEWGDPDLV